MIIKQLYTDNVFRNFNYLIVCEATGKALAVDPIAVDLCLSTAKKNDWQITQILNTHEHGDHIGGNDEIQKATGANILAHHNAINRIPNIDTPLYANYIVNVGTTVKLRVLDTPGHTKSHVCLLTENKQPALFCGDTLFNAGAGNCHGGGHPELLYDTFHNQLSELPNNILVYPGHDYITNNLGFTLAREPDNQTAIDLMKRVENHDPHYPLVTTLDLEKQINVFLRLDSATVIERLRKDITHFPSHPTAKQVFLALRELRNQW